MYIYIYVKNTIYGVEICFFVLDVTLQPVVSLSETGQCRNSGVARLDSNFYLLCVFEIFHSSIRVYNAKFRLQNSTNITAFENPRDIAACRRCRCLYVADGTGDVWRVNLTNNVRGFAPTKFNWKVNAFSLSVSPWGNLTITELGNNRLTTYNPEFQSTSRVDLSKFNDSHTLHAAEISDGSWLICQRVRSVDGSTFGRVFEVDKQLNVLRASKQSRAPVYLASDKDSGHVFVADATNNEVLVFDRELSHSSLLISGNSSLSRINFDSVSKMLIVLAPHRVDVYRVCDWVQKC